jgi:3',5'-cyclic AMP phosphodiesterase CpdA
MSEIVSTPSTTSTAMTTQDFDNVRILHLTDLHCGRGFQHDLWDHLESITRALKPQLILVTGDLVNNPYWWTLRRAQGLLNALSAAATIAADQKPKVFVIPGNHDTRLTGLLPVVWITPIVVCLFAIVSIGGYLHHFPHAWMWSGPIALLLLLFRYCCLRNFSSFFQQYIPQCPTTLTDLNLVLYPFDSATSPTSWAGGNIPLSQFVDARKPSVPTGAAPYRIAIVHHHSVPIPHDSKSETLMVLKNAGAFLSEIASVGVRLVLSGHKHHQHISRVTINAETDKELELTVVNTGSPTAGKYPGAYGHNFSFIEVCPQSGAQITQYRSDGGPFNPLTPFWVDSVENCGKALLRENKARQRFHYDALENNIVINEDGDAFHTLKVRGFSFLGEGEISALPIPWSARVATGQIEQPLVRPDPGSPVETQITWSTRERQYVEGQINLSRPIRRGHKPFGFSIDHHAINAYAMSSQQFDLLHAGQKTGSHEYAELVLRRAPVSSLSIRVTLPPNFKLSGEPELLILRGESAEERFQRAYASQLNFDPGSNVISVTIPCPPLGLGYRLVWGLTDDAPPAGRSSRGLRGEAAMIADRLLDLADHDPKGNLLSKKLLPAIGQEARREFTLDPEANDPLLLTIMVFDRNRCKLRIAAANLDEADQQWKTELAYGDGIAGRAFKMNTVRLFIKAKSKQNRIPFYYADGTGNAPSDNGDEIKEEALISLPLSHPDEPQTTFAVLNISSRKRNSKLVDLTDDRITTQFRLAVSKACFEAIKELSWS